MATYVSRGNVAYTIPDSVGGSETIAPANLRAICEILVINWNEYQGIVNVYSNPDRTGLAKDVRLPGYDATTLNNIERGISSGGIISVNNINDILSQIGSLNSSLSNIGQGLSYSLGAVGNSGTVTTTPTNTFVTVLNQLSNIYNNFNGWWDANNICARSCQVSCQQACQLACQGCNTSTNHKQNCGGWS